MSNQAPKATKLSTMTQKKIRPRMDVPRASTASLRATCLRSQTTARTGATSRKADRAVNNMGSMRSPPAPEDSVSR